MKNPSEKSRKPMVGESVERITLSIASADKKNLERLAKEKRVSVGWVVRDAISKYFSGQSGISNSEVEP